MPEARTSKNRIANRIYVLALAYTNSLRRLQYGVQASSRSQPRHAMRLPNFFAMGGGSQACTSSWPRGDRAADTLPRSSAAAPRREFDSSLLCPYSEFLPRREFFPA